VGAPAENSARVFSGVDGSVLYNLLGLGNEFAFGSSVSGAGDVNGDGFDDVIVGDPIAFSSSFVNAGSTRVFSGVDGSLLYNLFGGDEFGTSVSGAGDVNGDGFADLLCSSVLGSRRQRPLQLPWR